MNCTECQDKFTEIFEDEVPRDRTTAFKAHLASCSSCASDFSGFKATVQTLQALPQQAVPADFLIGINEKLDRNAFARLKSWFSFMGQHKLTASATMATLIVGVISATILPISPETNQTQLTGNKTTYTQVITTQKETKNNENNYYPGVPYLAGKQTEPQSMSPRINPPVQFASTNPQNGYYGVQNPRGSPQSYERDIYTSLNTQSGVRSTNPKPDFHIIIHPASPSQQQVITRRISSNSNWKTHLHNSTLFVTLTDQQLPEFQKLFPASAPPHKRLDFTPLLANKTQQQLFTIAISFE